MRYLLAMQTTIRPYIPFLAGALLVMILTVAAFATLAGWSAYGSTILLTYAENGLAWCF